MAGETRYLDCPVCGLFQGTVYPPWPYAHEHDGVNYACQELRAEDYQKRRGLKNFKESQMKTCETCKGTGQVAEPIKVGDIIENPSGGLGVVVSGYVNRVLDSEYPRAKDDIRYALISGGAKAWGAPGGTYTADPKTLTVRHGHIHIDR